MITQKICKMLNYFQNLESTSFDIQLFKEVSLLVPLCDNEKNLIVYSFYTKKEYCENGFFPKGALVTLTDILPALHIYALDDSKRLITTISLSSTFTLQMKSDTHILIKSVVKHIDKDFGHTSTEIIANNEPSVVSSQIYAFLDLNLKNYYNFYKTLN